MGKEDACVICGCPMVEDCDRSVCINGRCPSNTQVQGDNRPDSKEGGDKQKNT